MTAWDRSSNLYRVLSWPGSDFGLQFYFLGGIRKLKGMCGEIRLPVFSTKVENPGTSTFLVFYLGGEVISRKIFEGFLN